MKMLHRSSLPRRRSARVLLSLFACGALMVCVAQASAATARSIGPLSRADRRRRRCRRDG